MMLKLVKLGKEYTVLLNEMMDEWTAANEKINLYRCGQYPTLSE